MIGDCGGQHGGPSVAFFITGLAVGGAETQVVRVATGLVTLGWRVHVVSLAPPTAFEDELRAGGVSLSSLGMTSSRHLARTMLEARRLVASVRPDVVCAFLFHATVVAAGAVAGPGRPVLISSVRDPTLGGFWRLGVHSLLDRARQIEVTVANSARVADAFERRRVVGRGRVVTIRNAIATKHDVLLPHDARAALGVSGQAFLWLAVGNILPQKDYPTLLRAFASVVERRPEARLWIAGGNGSPPEVSALAQPLGDRVRFLGLRDDVPRLLAAADAYVLSSASEGFPNALIEALLAEKPTVATEVGGVPELVLDGQTGVLVKPRNPPRLAAAMIALMGLPEAKRRELGAAGARRVRELHDAASILGEWDALLRRVTTGARR